MIKVQGTEVVATFGEEVVVFEAAKLDERCRLQAVAYAVAGRMASVATAAKGKPDAEVVGKIRKLVEGWMEGEWTRRVVETAEEQLARKMGLTVEELMAKLAK